jgi:hypothetical protein
MTAGTDGRAVVAAEVARQEELIAEQAAAWAEQATAIERFGAALLACRRPPVETGGEETP